MGRAMLIVDTIVPWTAEWLLHYEVWLATGEWLGDGDAGRALPTITTTSRHYNPTRRIHPAHGTPSATTRAAHHAASKDGIP